MAFARLTAVALAASLLQLLAPSASALKLKFRYEVGLAQRMPSGHTEITRQKHTLCSFWSSAGTQLSLLQWFPMSAHARFAKLIDVPAHLFLLLPPPPPRVP